MKFVSAFALSLALAVSVGAGSASATSCSAGAEGKVLQNPGLVAAACDAGSENNDKLNPLQVNLDEIHDFDDWQYAGKFNLGGLDEAGDVDVGFSVSGGLQSGSFSFDANLFDLFANAMIVIKGGNGNNTQETYVGYLLSSLLSPNGTYSSPFFTLPSTNKNGVVKLGEVKDISHISAYVRGEPTTVIPLPAAGLLLLSGLAGLGFIGRRRAA